MVLGYHVVFCTYGFWLPNDPRGSASLYVGSGALYRVGGKATRDGWVGAGPNTPHNFAARLIAKRALKYPPVELSGRQARAVGVGFARTAVQLDMRVWACAILPGHVHLVLARHELAVEEHLKQMRQAAIERLIEERLHPFAKSNVARSRIPTIWAKGEWKVFLNTVEDIRGAIEYVERNPIEAGLSPQKWSFVSPCDGDALPHWAQRRNRVRRIRSR